MFVALEMAPDPIAAPARRYLAARATEARIRRREPADLWPTDRPTPAQRDAWEAMMDDWEEELDDACCDGVDVLRELTAALADAAFAGVVIGDRLIVPPRCPVAL